MPCLVCRARFAVVSFALRCCPRSWARAEAALVAALADAARLADGACNG